MLRTTALAFALTLPLTHAAQAQSGGLTFEGTLGLGLTDVLEEYAIGFADVTLGIPITRRVPLSFEVGTYFFALDGKRPHETYAAFAWDDRYRIGAIRPAYDAVLPSVFEDIAPFLAYSRAEYARSHNTVEAMRRTAVPWGASAEGQTGGLSYAVSVHDAEDSGFHSASASFTWTGPGWQVLGAVESLWSDDMAHDGVNAKLGARMMAGPVDLGATYLRPEGNARSNALSLDAAWPVSGRVTLHALGEFTADSAEDAYGLGLTTSVGNGGRLNFAATDGDVGTGLHAGVTLDF